MCVETPSECETVCVCLCVRYELRLVCVVPSGVYNVCVCVNQTCSQKVCVLQVCCWLKDFRVSYDNDNDENVRNQPV